MIYRILLDDIRRELENILISDRNNEILNSSIKKGKTREEVHEWAKVRYEILMEKDSKDRVVVYPERDFSLVRNWLEFLYYEILEKYDDGEYENGSEVLETYIERLLKKYKSDIVYRNFTPKETIVITMEDIKEQYELWLDGKITRAKIEYWADRRSEMYEYRDDIEYYPMEKEYLLKKWLYVLSIFALGGEGDYFYSDEDLRKKYKELCKDMEKAEKEFEEKLKEIENL